MQVVYIYSGGQGAATALNLCLVLSYGYVHAIVLPFANTMQRTACNCKIL